MYIMYKLIFISYFLSLNLLLSTTFMPKKFDNLVRDSDRIILAKTISNTARKGVTNKGVRVVYTYNKVEVLDVLKGDISSKVITIRTTGGTIDGMTTSIPGTPELIVGEEDVFLLGNINEDGSYNIRNMIMGKYSVKNTDNGKVITGINRLLGEKNQKKYLNIEELNRLIKRQETFKELDDIKSTFSKKEQAKGSVEEKEVETIDDFSEEDRETEEELIKEKTEFSNNKTLLIIFSLLIIISIFVLIKRKK